MLMRLLLRLLQRRMDISNNLCYRAPRALFTLLPFLPIAAFNKMFLQCVHFPKCLTYASLL